jgi:hypothetical protein
MAAFWAVFTFGDSGPAITAHGSLDLKQEIQIQIQTTCVSTLRMKRLSTRITSKPSLLKRVKSFQQHYPAQSKSDSTQDAREEDINDHAYTKVDVVFAPRREKNLTPFKFQFESRRIIDLDHDFVFVRLCAKSYFGSLLAVVYW